MTIITITIHSFVYSSCVQLCHRKRQAMSPYSASMGACAVEVYVDMDNSTGKNVYQLKRTERFGQFLAKELLAVAGVSATFLTYEGKGFIKALHQQELTEIKTHIVEKQPDTLVVMLGFNDGSTPDTNTKW